MVTQNRHDGGNSSGWWDDLPPAVKKRVSPPVADPEPPPEPSPPAEPPNRPTVASDLSRLAVLFLLVALANVLFLLVALAFLSGHNPLGP